MKEAYELLMPKEAMALSDGLEMYIAAILFTSNFTHNKYPRGPCLNPVTVGKRVKSSSPFIVPGLKT